jgi:hypothetical protein
LRSISEFNVVIEKLRDIQEESDFIEVLGILERAAMDRSGFFFRLEIEREEVACGKQEAAYLVR